MAVMQGAHHALLLPSEWMAESTFSWMLF